MGLYNKMSRADKKKFQQLGIIKGTAKSYTLVFTLGGKEEIIMPEKQYALCAWKQKQIEAQSEYQRGTFRIEGNF